MLLETARNIGRFFRVLALRFWHDGCLLHASALAYTTLLSIVPLLALMFAVLKGLGARERLEGWLLTQFGLGAEASQQVVRWVEGVNVGTLTSLGVSALILTAVSLLSSVEASLNHIWRVAAGRVWWRKLSDYTSVVLLTPLLLLAGFGATSFVAEQATLQGLLDNEIVGEAWARGLRLVPYGFNVLALGIVYGIMPNRRPDLRAVAIAAFFAGISWQGVQEAYVHLQIGVVRANLIYGALAQLPVTLVWLYVSWTIVLAGAELAALLEFGADSWEREGEIAEPSAVAFELLVRAADRFARGGHGIAPAELGGAIGVGAHEVTRVAQALVEAGFLVPVEGTRRSYCLGRDPGTIELSAVVQAAEGSRRPHAWDARVRGARLRADHGRDQSLSGLTLASLLSIEPGASASEPLGWASGPLQEGRD